MFAIMLAVMVGIVAIFGTLTYFLLTVSQKKRDRVRALSVIRGHNVSDSKNTEKNAQDKRRAEIAKKLQNMDSGAKARRSDLKLRLVQAGMPITVKQFYLFSVIFGALMTGLMLAVGQPLHVVVLVCFAMTFGFPRFVLRFKTKRRQKKFLAEFADALEAMTRLLKAGMPVSEAISMASREFGGPIGEEMTRIYDSQKIGIPLPEAALEAARRMPLTEMQMFATGLAIQAQTGSSLSEVLMNLARVIRSRYKLKRKIQALSSEAKASAMIIGALPFLVGGGMYAINPEFIGVLFETKIGNAWLIGSGCWMGLGILVMRQMINFKV